MEKDNTVKIGPNVKQLISHKMSLDAVPPGGGFADAVALLLDREKLLASNRAAIDWVKAALAAIKAAPDNTFGEDDEAIAGELLRRIDERKLHHN
jgi:hypothetical protein